MKPELIDLKKVQDKRGALSVMDCFPFQPKRFFFIYGAPKSVMRGGHAHRKQHQIIVCAFGWANVLIDKAETVLRQPDQALYVPPMNWVEIHIRGESSVMVLSSGEYDETDYIRDRIEFDRLVAWLVA